MGLGGGGGSLFFPLFTMLSLSNYYSSLCDVVVVGCTQISIHCLSSLLTQEDGLYWFCLVMHVIRKGDENCVAINWDVTFSFTSMV